MVPVAFGGCFGWFHPAARPGGFAVLLCPPLGRESRWVYRTFRKLADRLAAAGLPTLRFDYPNSGDSCDLPADCKLVAAWQDSVHAAADWLRAQTGAGHLALAGIRFGALLAAEAARTRHDVAALALLAPVISGRTYVRELRALARVAESATSASQPVEMDGLILDEPMLNALGAMAMPSAAAPAPHVLLLQHGHAGDAYAGVLGTLGVDVTVAPFSGYADLMRSAVSNIVPEDDIDRVVAWMEGLDLPATPGRLQPLQQAVLRPDGCVEQPMSFGAGQPLYGILCRPDCDRPADRVVVIGNSGGDPRTGISRLAVMLARRLARQGIASLRMDFAGLGDSMLGPEDRDGHLYAIDRCADFTAAIDALERLGFRHFAAFGLCTGAYHVLAAAAADGRIDAVSLVNLATFRWAGEDPVDVSSRTQFRASAAYLAGLASGANWRRMVRGDVALRKILEVFAYRVAQRVGLMIIHAMNDAGFGLSWPSAAPRRTMRGLVQRGVKIQMLLSGEDAGIDLLEAHFGRRGRKLLALGGTEVIIRPSLDHTLSLRRMRDEAIDIAAGFFVRAAKSVQETSGGGRL